MRKRILAMLLAVLMLASLLPVTAAAGDEGVYKKISSMDELTTGKYVMVLDTGYAPGILDGTWVTAVQPSVTDESVTDPTDGVWTLTVSGNSVQLTDANGVTIAPSGGENNGIKSGNYSWEVRLEDGKFSFYGTGEDTVTFASNKSSDNKFRAYKNSTINAGYPHDFTLYKLEEGSTEPEPETVPISTALAGTNGTSFTVKGVVTLLDGKNVYIQDSTGGICLYFSSTPSGIDLGDTVIGSGEKTEYNGLPELESATFQKSSGMTLSAAEKTIDGLTTSDICKYVKISGVEVTEVDDNGGSYFAPNITVEDENGNTIQIYKAVVGKDGDGSWKVKVGDKLNVTAAVGVYKTTLQLRTTLESEIVVLGGEDPGPEPAGPLSNGDKVVIYNPANSKALSTTYNGFYNNGTDVTINSDGTLSGVTTNDVWTVGVDADGNYTFSTADGQKLGMDDSYTSMPLGGKNDTWTLEDAGNGCYYIKNVVRGNYIEWYSSNNYWSSYSNNSDKELFAQKFWIVNDVEIPEPGGGESGELPADGAQVMIYNISAKGVLAGQIGSESSPSIANAPATVAEDKATAENGGVVFTVSIVDGWYRFYNEAYGYLCSNGTGNNAFYSETAGDDADWKLKDGKSGGFNLESRKAKFNNNSQYLEYYSDSYKTYSMYNVTDYDIYEFFFYPCANTEDLTSGVVNKPTVTITGTDAYAGVAYEFTVDVNAVFGVADSGLTVKVGDTPLTKGENGVYTVPAELVTGASITITVSGKDTKGKTISGSKEVAVKDEPVITEVSPAQGAETGDDKRPTISAKVENAGENPTVTMTVNGETVTAAYADGEVTYTPSADLADGRVSVELTVKRSDDKEGTKSWSFTVGKAEFTAYFGQLHSHTGEFSDGSGTLQEALDHVSGIPENDNIDFVAFTDHSNYFDSTSAQNPAAALYDMTQMTEESAAKWATYTGTIDDFNASSPDRIALAGYEMTWSGGPGHINTFNTPGIVSRNSDSFSNKKLSNSEVLQNYYNLLIEAGNNGVDSINQLNHPGTTFGNFEDFAFYNPLLDSYVQLVEVGNGEGQIGAGGYYPSYEQYIMALDKGWHVAPTNNQDNHKGSWGNANDARDVIFADQLSEDGLFDAIRDRRLYATEDKNLEISYTLDGHVMGSQLGTDDVDENVNIAVTVYDPDYSDGIAKVEVVVNSGRVAYTWDSIPASGELSCSIPADYSYYFIRVTQRDGDLAVTAPVWVGEVLKLGIDSVTSGTANPVTGEELTITANLFNTEAKEAVAKSVAFSVDGVVEYTAKDVSIASGARVGVPFTFTPDTAKLQTVSVSAVIELDGKEYTFTGSIQIDVQDGSKLVYIGIDASHYNEYVNGNYKDSMGNFSSLAMQNGVRTVQLDTSEELIAACENANGKYKAIVLTAPSRRLTEAQTDPKVYSDAEIAALKAFNAAGGVVIVTGWSDNYENYDVIQNNDGIMHMAATQNAVLAALGSSLRIGDDATYDDVRCEDDNVDPWRLYFSDYNWDSFLVKGVIVNAEKPYDKLETERFSHYGGASIYADADTLPDTVTPVVFAHETTYSKDVDEDGLGGTSIPKYAYTDGTERLLIMATEQLDGRGLIVVSGAAFLSNFEVQASVESGAEKNYSNYKICENLVKYLNPDGLAISTIKQVQDEENEGVRFTIEGVVTSNASGYDKDTAFFDCIYVQDGTAGINVFPVAGSFKLGDKVRITGHTSSYQGERQLSLSLGSIEKIGETTPVQPAKITAEQLNNLSYLGSLVTLEGTVTDVSYANGLVQDILVKDAAGNVGRVFIDGYITTGADVQGLEVGCKISATGLASYDNTYSGDSSLYPRIRVRDRADIICTEGGDEPDTPDIPDIPLPPVTPTPTPTPEFPFDDVKPGDWFYNDVVYVYEKGIMDGVDNRVFSPNTTLNRAMFVTMLYRAAGEPAVKQAEAFKDVPAGTWFTDAVIWASSCGIVDGYGEDMFGPYNSLTREQLATILYRYAKWCGEGVYAPADALAGFADAANVSDYALEAMRWAVYTGLIEGSDSGLQPQSGATRAQVAAIIHRYLEK